MDRNTLCLHTKGVFKYVFIKYSRMNTSYIIPIFHGLNQN